MVVLVAFLAVRDSRMPLTTFQFLAMSILLATALGVVNELVEFASQATGIMVAADDLFDTWEDLASNTIGSVLAAGMLAPFLRREDA